MRFYKIEFFVEEKSPAYFHADFDPQLYGHISPWPITALINVDSSDGYSSQNITLYFSEQQFINFKNSVLQSYEKYLRQRKELLNV